MRMMGIMMKRGYVSQLIFSFLHSNLLCSKFNAFTFASQGNNAWDENSSDESSEADGQDEEMVEERIPMEVPTGLRRLLEHDCTLINKQNKVYFLLFFLSWTFFLSRSTTV